MSALDRRVVEIVEHGTANGWTMHSEPVDVDGCTSAVGIGGCWPLVDGREFMFFMALGVSEHSGRVQTLKAEPHSACVTVELHGTLAARLGQPRYWWSARASAWRDALVDPLTWCSDFDPSAPDTLAPAEH